MTHPSDEPNHTSPTSNGAAGKSGRQPSAELLMRLETWQERKGRLAESATLAQAFAVYAEGVRLIGELDVDTEAAKQLLHELESLAGSRLAPQSESDAAVLARETDRLLDELDYRFYQLTGDAASHADTVSRRIESLGTQLEAMAPLLSLLKGEQWEPYRRFMANLEGLEREIKRRQRNLPKEAARFEAVQEELVHVRAEAVRTQAEAFLEQLPTKAAALPGEAPSREAERLWLLLDEAEFLIIQLYDKASPPGEADERIAHLDEKTNWLTERIHDALGRIEGEEERNEWLDAHLGALRDLASDTLTDAEDLELHAASASMERMRLRIGHFLELWPNDRNSKPLKPLRRRQKKLRNEWVEKTTSFRLERRFSKRFVTMLENAVLLAILAVTALLIYEFATDRSLPSPSEVLEQRYAEQNPEWEAAQIQAAVTERLAQEGAEEWMPTDESRFVLALQNPDWGDARIQAHLEGEQSRELQLALLDLFFCLIFLFEFFLKFLFTPMRGNYFKRHWLFSLLPSIPFGIIVYALQYLPVLQNLTGLRAVRLLRLPRLVRYVRVIRPAIRLMRLVLFALRGMDKIVRRYGPLLNRDLVFFEPPARHNTGEVVLERAEKMRRNLRIRKRDLSEGMPAEALADTLSRQVELSRDQVPYAASIVTWPAEPMDESALGATAIRTKRAVRVEDAIERLIHADADSIEETMGPDFPMQMDKLSRVATLPPLRWMPIFRQIVRARKVSKDRSERAALIANALGEYLQLINRRVTWVADLNGVISPPQFVDRIGSTLVAKTKRPAKRLIMFGGGVVVITALVNLLEISTLAPVLEFLQGFVGTPLLVIGGIALTALLIGKWLQHIASAASDFFARAAEATYLGLLQDVKHSRAVPDFAVLDRRVLRPEALAQGVIEQIGTPPAHHEPATGGAPEATSKLVGGAAAAAGNGEADGDGTATAVQAAPRATAVADEASSTASTSSALTGSGERSHNPHDDAAGGDPNGTNEPVPTATQQRLIQQATSQSGMIDAPKLFRRGLRERFDSEEALAGSLPERVYLMYRDYLSGAPLHRGGTRTANQLLGNLSMLEVIERVLNLSKKEKKELEKLDLERAGGLGGPAMWFNAVTLAVAQRTARLVIDYNRYVIPQEEIGARPESERERYAAWLKDKVLENKMRETVVVDPKSSGSAQPPEELPEIEALIARLSGSTPEEVHAEADASYQEAQERVRQLRDEGLSEKKAKEKAGYRDKHVRELSGQDDRVSKEVTQAAYSTTAFTALDFLTNDRRRYDDTLKRFGPELAELMRIDRLRLIRDIFGTIPGYAKPRAERSINPYNLYWDYVGGGRIFFLPFRMGWHTLRYSIKGLRWFIRVVHELINPKIKKPYAGPSVASFDVALRKINRMRKPIFLAATELRARLDVEYCGLLLPGEWESGLEGEGLDEDLERIEANHEEVEPFHKLRHNHRSAMRELTEFLRRNGMMAEGMTERLEEIEPGYAKRRREVLRAITAAYIVDYEKFRQFASAKPRLHELVASAVAHNGAIPDQSWWVRPIAWTGRATLATAAIATGVGRMERVTFAAWWQRYVVANPTLPDGTKTDSPNVAAAVRAWWQANVYDFQEVVRLASAAPLGDTDVVAMKIVEHVLRHPRTWTDQLVTLRTIQSLTLLDIFSDRRIVRNLGEFTDAVDEPEQEVIVPTLR